MLPSKKTIRILGTSFTIFGVLIAIIVLVLAGIQYRFVGPDFVDNPYKALPATQIATVVFSFFMLLLSFMAFAKPNMKFSLTVSVLMILSLLFNLSIAIYSFMGGNVGWVNIREQCSGKYKGVLGAFSQIDTYLQEIDQAMCSDSCPCYITNTDPFETNSTIKPFYNLWKKRISPPGVVLFQNCSLDLQDYALKEALRRDVNFAEKKNFDKIKFYQYMSNVENSFKCSGWCDVEYFNPNYNLIVIFAKYLFSDINRGPPIYFGCLNELIQWIPAYLNAWGSMTMLLFATQFTLFCLLICQYHAREKDHEKKIPHYDDVRN